MNRLQISELLEKFQRVRNELKHISQLNFKSVAERVTMTCEEIEKTLQQLKREL